MRRGWWVGCAGVILSTAIARGGIVPVSQVRTVQASASETYTQDQVPGSDTRQDHKSSPDLGLFDVSLSEQTQHLLGRATADQTSHITADQIDAIGHVSMVGALTPPSDLHLVGSGSATGASSFSLTFDVTSPTSVSLDILLVSDGSAAVLGANLASTRLTGPSGALFDISTTSPNSTNTLPLTTQQDLDVGRYTLEASASAQAPPPLSRQPNTQAASFQFTLSVVPEPLSLSAAAALLFLVHSPRRQQPTTHHPQRTTDH